MQEKARNENVWNSRFDFISKPPADHVARRAAIRRAFALPAVGVSYAEKRSIAFV
jgi:hypothetical protein